LFNIDESELRFDGDYINQSHEVLQLSERKSTNKKKAASIKRLRESSDIENTLKKLKKIRHGMNILKNKDLKTNHEKLDLQKFKMGTNTNCHSPRYNHFNLQLDSSNPELLSQDILYDSIQQVKAQT
jgi:hypothetical protein